MLDGCLGRLDDLMLELDRRLDRSDSCMVMLDGRLDDRLCRLNGRLFPIDGR